MLGKVSHKIWQFSCFISSIYKNNYRKYRTCKLLAIQFLFPFFLCLHKLGAVIMFEENWRKLPFTKCLHDKGKALIDNLEDYKATTFQHELKRQRIKNLKINNQEETTHLHFAMFIQKINGLKLRKCYLFWSVSFNVEIPFH